VISLRPRCHLAALTGCSNMAIEQDEIEKIAELARIRIDSEQVGELTQRITEILAMADRLQAIDTSAVAPLSNPLDATQRLRVDEVTESNLRDGFQAIAPAVQDGLYLVPKVID
jgi:aspartyl-tRNA(Asn)/glutamyl-tRNA(Gln) amidotransferase subunit C